MDRKGAKKKKPDAPILFEKPIAEIDFAHFVQVFESCKSNDFAGRLIDGRPAAITVFPVVFKQTLFQSLLRFLQRFNTVAGVAGHIWIADHPEQRLRIIQDEFPEQQPVSFKNGFHRASLGFNLQASRPTLSLRDWAEDFEHSSCLGDNVLVLPLKWLRFVAFHRSRLVWTGTVC